MEHVTGLDEILKNMDEALRRLEQAAATAIYGEQIALLELINRKGMVPVQTGALQHSAYVTPPVRRADGSPVSELGYGADYAPSVHEDPTRQGSGRRGYKWVEKAVNIHLRGSPDRLREATSRAFAQGATPESLAGLVPQFPQHVSELTKYQRKYGFTQAQRKAIRRAARKGPLKLVRRWKRGRKK